MKLQAPGRETGEWNRRKAEAARNGGRSPRCHQRRVLRLWGQGGRRFAHEPQCLRARGLAAEVAIIRLEEDL